MGGAPLHLLHPVAVHFPIALLSLGLAVQALAAARRGPQWLGEGARWLLWLGAASAWAALGLGLLAEETVPHVPAAWEVLHEHETLAYWTAGTFTALALAAWRWRGGRARLLTALWAGGLALLLATAWHGGELVYAFGVGVAR